MASISASPSATRWMKASRLVITLIAEAAPSGPTWKTRRPSPRRRAGARSQTASSPPTRTVISPWRRRWTPPVTGRLERLDALRRRQAPRAGASRAGRCVLHVDPGAAATQARRAMPSRPASTASVTAAGEGRQVTTASLASCDLPRRAGDARAAAPARRSPRPGRRSCTVERETRPQQARGKVAAELRRARRSRRSWIRSRRRAARRRRRRPARDAGPSRSRDGPARPPHRARCRGPARRRDTWPSSQRSGCFSSSA